MASLYTQQSRNVRKTFFLMGVFLMVVIGIGWLVSAYLGSPIILYIVVIVAVVMNIGAYWKSDTIAIRLTRAKPIDRESHREYWNIVENLCISIGVPMPKLYLIDDQSPNAFATGRNPENAAVVVTQGLLDMMDRNELEGVLAHELAHIQNRDTLLMTAVVVLFGVVTLLLDFIMHFMIFSGGDDDGPNLFMVAAMIATFIFAPIILTLIQLAISRKREYLADATAGVYTRYPDGLASALRKIRDAHQPMRHAKNATAHLFITDPFAVSKAHGGSSGIRFAHLFDTHPPVEKRIAALIGQETAAPEKD